MLGTLKVRLYFLVCIITLPAVLMIFYQTTQERQQAIQLHAQQAVTIAQLLFSTQEKIIGDTEHYLEYLASIPEVQQPGSSACGQFLSKILKFNPTYINIGVPSANGDLLCNALPLEQDVNVFERPYFQQSLTQHAFAIGRYQLDRASGKTSINFSYPVVDLNDQLVGVVVAVVSLDAWSQWLAEYNLPVDAVVFVTDEQARIVANYPFDSKVHGRDPDNYNVNIEPSQHYQLVTEQVTGTDQVLRIFTHQTLYTKLDNKGVTVSVGIPIDSALNHINERFMTRILSFLACVLVVTLLAIKILNTSLIKPLEKLTQATFNLRLGIQPQGLNTQGAKEIRILEEHFLRMSSARLTAERVAKKRSSELDAVFSALPDLYFRVDTQEVIVDYRAANTNDLYVSPDVFVGNKISDVLPEEIGQLWQQKTAELRDKKEVVTWEYRLSILGDEQHFEARVNSISNSQDIIVVIRNISERKKDEESLKLAASVFSNSRECMVVTDHNGSIIDVNPAFTQVTGYQKHEVLGKNPSILASGIHGDEFYAKLWQCLSKDGRWEGEIYNKRKDGEVFPEWLSINAIYQADGSVSHFIALYRDITEQKKSTEIIWRQAHYDPLTNLPNRRTLSDHLNHQLSVAQRNQTLSAVLFIDIDDFKHINDSLGHDMGDLLLQRVAQRLRDNTRSQDMIARQGGDEFIVVMGDLSSISPVIRLAERLLTSFERPFLLKEETIFVSASVGLAFYPNDGETAAELLKKADQAMYAAKQAGKNCFRCFTQIMQDQAEQRIRLVRELRYALQDSQFELYYQPIVSLKTGKVAKAEALIRWNHPERGLVAPDEFIPLAEQTKLIIPIGEWVFNKSCQVLKTLQQRYGEDFRLSINVSPVQFADAECKLLKWPEYLSGNDIQPSSIVVEITEGLLMDNKGKSLSALLHFRDAGFQVSLDDFGTGYSSLAYIQEYDIDYLKIDRHFVQQLNGPADSAILCESIIVMAHKLGIEVIAEGVETLEQQQALADMGCDYVQGYLYSRPIPLAKFIQLT